MNREDIKDIKKQVIVKTLVGLFVAGILFIVGLIRGWWPHIYIFLIGQTKVYNGFLLLILICVLWCFVIFRKTKKFESPPCKTKNVNLINAISVVAENIIKECVMQDTTEFDDASMIRKLSHSKIEIEAAIDELVSCGLVLASQVATSFKEGWDYYFTTKGKKYMLGIKKKFNL